MSLRRKTRPVQRLGYSNSSQSEDYKYLFDDAHCELLAYLEYCVRDPSAPGDFLRTASKHLATALCPEWTATQIEGKLGLFSEHWGLMGANPSGSKKLLILGLKALPRLPRDFQEEILRRTDDIEQSTFRTRALRSASRTPTSIRTTTPSRLGRKTKFRLQATRGLSTTSPSPLRRAIASGTLTPPIRREQPVIEISVSSKHIPWEAPAILQPATPTPFKIEKPSFEITDSQDRASEHGSASFLISGQVQQPSFESPHLSDDLSQTGSPLSTICDSAGPEIAYQALRSMYDLSLARIDTLETNLEELKLQKNNEIEYLWERSHQAEANIIKERARYDRLHAKAVPRGPGVISHDSERSREETTSEVHRELAKCQAILLFSKDSSETFPQVNEASVIINFDRIYRTCRDVLQDHDSAFTLERESLVNDDDLCALMKRVFGVDVKQSTDPSELCTLLTGFSIRSVFRCLLSAAVCEWVFETDLKSLFQERDLLYSGLREGLARQNLDVTQCLEYSVLQGALKNPMTKECIIPMRAKLLARRLLGKLLPLIQCQRLPGRTPGSIERDWRGEEDRLTDIFGLALQTATTLLISTNVYRCVYRLPGLRMSSSMRRDAESSTASAGHGALVGATIFPGLQRCAANERNLTFKRFLKPDEDHGEMTWETLCTALVSAR